MLNYINRHKGISIVVGLSIILLIIMVIIFASLFLGGGGSKYGNRLDGIEEVKLENSFLQEIEDGLKDDETVVDANVRLQGKIVYIVFEVNSDISIDTAKLMSSNILEKFSSEELAFYDISYLVKWTNIVEEEEVVSAIAGTKHHKKDSITWSKS